MTAPTIAAVLDLLEPPERILICHPDRRSDVDAELARLEADGVAHRVTVKTSRWMELDEVLFLDPHAGEKALAKSRHPSSRKPVDSPPRGTQALWEALRSLR